MTLKSLSLFVGHDDVRDWMKTPFRYRGSTMASNGWVMVVVPDEKTDCPTLSVEHHNNVDGILASEKNLASTSATIIDVAKLDDAVAKLDTKIECENCLGRGRYICRECGDVKAKCPKCGGRGAVKVHGVLGISNVAAFSSHVLRPILAVARELGVERLGFRFMGGISFAAFSIGSVKVFAVPSRVEPTVNL